MGVIRRPVFGVSVHLMAFEQDVFNNTPRPDTWDANIF
jgi:hypothetical protein